MPKTKTEITAIRDLIKNLGLLSKLLIEFIPALEDIMKTEKDLKASLDGLTASVNKLTTAVTNLPPPPDLTPDIAVVDSLKAQVDAAAASLTPPAEPPAPETPPAA